MRMELQAWKAHAERLKWERDTLRSALAQIANEDYEPIEDSFTRAAAAIARTALATPDDGFDARENLRKTLKECAIPMRDAALSEQGEP